MENFKTNILIFCILVSFLSRFLSELRKCEAFCCRRSFGPVFPWVSFLRTWNSIKWYTLECIKHSARSNIYCLFHSYLKYSSNWTELLPSRSSSASASTPVLPVSACYRDNSPLSCRLLSFLPLSPSPFHPLGETVCLVDCSDSLPSLCLSLVQRGCCLGLLVVSLLSTIRSFFLCVLL